LHRGGETCADLGGLEALKAFCARALRPGRRAGVSARGVLLLGPPGSGKSAMAKALGNETGRPTLVLDVGALMGSLVRATEANVRQALRVVDAMAPAVLFLDEVEKALAGVQSSGQTDSGGSAPLRLALGLVERSCHRRVHRLHGERRLEAPARVRARRGSMRLYFLDLPGVKEKEAIWRLYLDRFGLDPGQPRPRDHEFTGAEVRACCRLAALLDVPLVEAARNIVPVAVTAGGAGEPLRARVGGRPVPVGRPPRGLHPGQRRHPQARPERPPGRPVGQLTIAPEGPSAGA